MQEALHFGPFRLLLAENALYKGKTRIRLQEHPATVLRVLLECPGKVVSREEIRARVWPNGTLVEFDHGINTAVNRLRTALGDRAEKPRYIETVARKGYRFIAEVRPTEDPSSESHPEPPIPSPTEILPDTVISHYRILRLIGSGAVGDVYEALDLNLTRRVALKFLTGSSLSDQKAIERFHREARAIAALDHPNICGVYEFDAEGGRGFLAIQLLEGETLSQRLQREGKLDISEVCRIATQVADGLAAAHDRQIIHRDIKPANLYLTRTGQVKILDFGLARIADADDIVSPGTVQHSSATATAAGAVMGTAAYMSPEQAQGRSLDQRTDIFSFGLVLYEMATGTHPFADVPESTIHHALLNDVIADASTRNPSLPSWLVTLISRMLEKDRKHRIQRVDEVRRTLAAHSRSATAWTRKRAAIAAGVLIGVISLWAVAASRNPESPGLTVAPVTSTSGLKEHVVASHDGSRIAFAWYADSGNEDIFVQNLNSHTPIRLTTGPARDFSPSWSPDGQAVAFLRTEFDRTSYFVVPATGGAERKLGEFVANPAAFCRQLDWSKTNNQIAVVEWKPRDAGGPELMIVSADDGKTLRRIPVEQGDFVCAPAFSPDGRFLAFLSGPDFRAADVHVIPAAGGLARRITNDARMIQGLAWAPDGSSIVYSLRRSGPFGLWRVPIGGSSASPLLETGNDIVDPYWASAGAGLIFVRDLWDTNLWRAPVRDTSGKSSLPVKVVASTREESSVDVSPDGSRIAFASARTGGFELWVSDVDGGRAQQLTDFRGLETGYPRWSPDSTRIAFTSYPDGRPAIYIVPASGGEKPRRLADGQMPFWSRDGERICFMQGVAGGMRVVCIPASGGTPSMVTEASGAMVRPTKDGSHLIVERHEALWLKNLSERGPGQLIVRPVAHGNWTTLGDEVCYLQYGAETVGVECLNLLSRKTASLTSVPAWPRVYGPPAFAIAPDRTWVIYGRTDQLESNIMRAVLPPQR